MRLDSRNLFFWCCKNAKEILPFIIKLLSFFKQNLSWNDSGWSSWFRNSPLLWTFPLSKTTKQFERVENLRLVQGLFLLVALIKLIDFFSPAPVYCLNSKTFPTMKHQVDLISFSKILLARFHFSYGTHQKYSECMN